MKIGQSFGKKEATKRWEKSMNSQWGYLNLQVNKIFDFSVPSEELPVPENSDEHNFEVISVEDDPISIDIKLKFGELDFSDDEFDYDFIK